MPKIAPDVARLDPVERLLYWITERHEIHRRRRRGLPKPWTADPILQRFRFCNVYRELDRVTEWIAEQWREPNADDPYLWFAMAVARLVNWPETLAEVGYAVPWRAEHFIDVLQARQARREKVFTGAYTVPQDPSRPGLNKAEFLAHDVLTPLWNDRKRLAKAFRGRLADAHRAMVSCRGIGGFIAGQVIADVKYVEPLRSADDWQTWAVSGPGSRRGLNRVLGRPPERSWVENVWLNELRALHREILPMIRSAKLPRLHAQDLQNALCEFDKYERVRRGEGQPRAKFDGLPPKRKGKAA